MERIRSVVTAGETENREFMESQIWSTRWVGSGAWVEMYIAERPRPPQRGGS